MNDDEATLAILRAESLFYQTRAAHACRHRGDARASDLKRALLRAGEQLRSGSAERWAYGVLAADPWADLHRRLPETAGQLTADTAGSQPVGRMTA